MEKILLTKYPKLCKEWHPTKNVDDKPKDFTHGSNEVVWWLCPNGHSYDLMINKRTRKSKPQGCGFCSGRRVIYENSLLYLFPDIAKEWHPTKNGNDKPDNVTKSSNKVVYWLCTNGHSYRASINERTRKDRPSKKCSECESLSFKFPEIAKEWHPTKNGNKSPDKTSYGSGEVVWWVCSKNKNHVYGDSVAHRTTGKRNCPFCRGRKVSEDNNLKFLFPQLAEEWHPTKNGDLKPEEVTYGSRQEVYWLCKNGHEFKVSVNNRTNNKDKPTGCDRCSNHSSVPEMRILSELKFCFNDIISRHKIDGIEIDIFLDSLNIGIEYDGFFYHKNRENEDKNKNLLLKSKNIKLIRVRHQPLKKIYEQDIIVKSDKLTKKDLNQIFMNIQKYFLTDSKIDFNKYFKSDDFTNDELFRNYLSYFPSPLPEHSIASQYPNLVNEWDYDKNHPLTPENFTPSSHIKVHWICPKNNKHNYPTAIYSRTGKNATGCPFCSGNQVTEEHNLKVIYPEIAKEWHPTKNGDEKPENVAPRSGKRYWWICPNNHSYDATVDNRTKKIRPQTCKRCKSLSFKFPEIAKEWHPTKNGNKTPDDISYGSKMKIWWLCPNNHSYPQKVYRRTSKNPPKCPDC